MKAVVVKTTNEVSIEELGKPLHMHTQPILGGMIEVVHPMRLPRSYVMLVNESGLLLYLDLNVVGCILYGTDAHGAPIVGNIIIMKEAVVNELGEHDIVGLTDAEAKHFTDLFNEMIYRAELREEDEDAEEA